MKILKLKILVITILIMMLTSYILIPSNVLAQMNDSQVQLYSKGAYIDFVQYDGQPFQVDYVVYSYKGNEYPAYSFQITDDKVSLTNSYIVNISNPTHFSAWEILYWGFPRRQPQEMGCMNEIEAYVATELAVASIAGLKNIESFTSLNESGQRIINVATQIRNIVLTTQTTKPKFNMKVVSDESEWTTDIINNNYLSKTYSIVCNNCEYERVTVSPSAGAPQNTRITDINNVEKQIFTKNEKFKVLLPKSSLTQNGSFVLNCMIEGRDNDVLQGNPINSNQTKYFLTTDGLRNLSGNIMEYYTELEQEVISDEQNNNYNDENEEPPQNEITNDTDVEDLNENTDFNDMDDKKPHIINKSNEDKELEQKGEMYDEMIEELKDVINMEMIDVNIILEYINRINEENEQYARQLEEQAEQYKKEIEEQQINYETELNKQNEDLQAIIKKQDQTIEETRQETNIIKQRENQSNNLPKLPRTGF